MKYISMLCAVCAVLGCSAEPEAVTIDDPSASASVLKGQWVLEADGSTMLDPQTSALTVYENYLVTIADNSAEKEQQRRLIFIDPKTHRVVRKTDPFRLHPRVRNGCFSDYLSNEPDFEALVHDPQQPGVFYAVTEDASATGALSKKCQATYENTGSTDYPTLLVRIEWDKQNLATITQVRPIQYPREFAVGDFPNDGIEGIALSPTGTLYLGLERDIANRPRIFQLQLDDAFWQTQAFAVVQDAELVLPRLDDNAHPINGLDYYVDPVSQRGFLLAAARNDDALWIIDAKGEWPARIILLHFTADSTRLEPRCAQIESLDNTSIEGLVVLQQQLWIINDPWKKNYLKNIRCEEDRQRFARMSPLLFSLSVDPTWFLPPSGSLQE